MTSRHLIAAAALAAVAVSSPAQTEKPRPPLDAKALADPVKRPQPPASGPVQSKPTQHKPFKDVTQVVSAAHADVMKRLGDKGAKANVELMTADGAMWQDGSLGCPEKGMNYTQALVPGFRVRMRVDNEVWDYHASRRGALVLCPVSRARTPAPSNRD